MLRLTHGSLLAVLLGWSFAAAQPPDAPAVVQVPRPKVAPWVEIKTGVGQLTLLTAGAKPATWALVDDTDADLHATKDATIVVFAASKVGKYRIVAFADGAEPIRVVMVVGTVVPLPVEPPPITPGPVDPPPVPTGPFFFVAIRKNAPADPSFTKIMDDPSWKSLEKLGHKYKEKTVKEAKDDLGIVIEATTVLPVVVTLQVSADGKSSTIVRGPIALPTTGDGILKLPEVK